VTPAGLLSILAIALAAAGLRRFWLGYPRPARSYACLAPREIAFVRAATEALFPVRGSLPVAGSEVDAPGYVDGWLALLRPPKRRQIRLLLCFFEHATLFFWAPGSRGWRRFTDLSLQQRTEVLAAWSASRWYSRRVVFTALRSALGLAYLGHPATMRYLRLAPFAFPSPVCEADLLYPPIGRDYDAIPYGLEDLTPPSQGRPIPLDSPVHPDYAETPL